MIIFSNDVRVGFLAIAALFAADTFLARMERSESG